MKQYYLTALIIITTRIIMMLQTFLVDYLKLTETERFMVGHQLRDLVF